MLTAPWIKRIELQTGEKSALPLRPDARLSTTHLTEDAGAQFDEHVMFDGVSWFHVTSLGKQWLVHGSTMSSGSALFVFMEYPEARHEELEAALCRDAHASEVYADWLAEQGDPFGGALMPALAKERGPAGLWWMEGFERNGAVTVALRDGFVREAVVGGLADELPSILHRLCHLRACVALERVVIEFDPRGEHHWKNLLGRPIWTACQWPRSLKTLAFAVAAAAPDEELQSGAPRPSTQELTLFRLKLKTKYPGLIIEG